jgi:MFS family permease
VDQPVDQPFEQPADQPVERSLHRPRSEEESPRLFGTAATIAAFCGFVLLGALQAYYGPAIPALRSKFGVAPSGAGLALSMYFGGAVTGVLVGGFVHRHTRNSRLLISSFLVMGLGALGFALAPAWPVALAASLVSGFGAGGMDYGLNQLFSIGFGRRSSAMLSILNAFYGVGAICGPLAISLLGATHYPAAFAGTAALLAVACAGCGTCRRAASRWSRPRPPPNPPPRTPPYPRQNPPPRPRPQPNPPRLPLSPRPHPPPPPAPNPDPSPARRLRLRPQPQQQPQPQPHRLRARRCFPCSSSERS